MSLNVIINYKVGNLHNLKNALDYLKLPVAIVEEPEAVRQADRILFPGVGAFGPAIQHLRDSGLLEVMEEKVQSGTPLLGICVGAQLLMDLGQEMVHIRAWDGLLEKSVALSTNSKFHRSAGTRSSSASRIHYFRDCVTAVTSTLCIPTTCDQMI